MKKVVQDLTSGGIDWQREKWQSGLGSKFIHQGEKNAVQYADEVIVLSKCVQDYFKEGFKAVHEYLVNGGKSCMAGFVLKNTLSDNGGVTRGICKMDEQNNLTEVVETKNEPFGFMANALSFLCGLCINLTITQDDPFVFLFIIYCNPTNPTVSTRKSTC